MCNVPHELTVEVLTNYVSLEIYKSTYQLRLREAKKRYNLRAMLLYSLEG